MVSNFSAAELTYVTLACVGLMFILKYGTILNRPRNWIKRQHAKLNDLFECSLCLGFWTGIILGFPYSLWYMPFISAGVCWITDVVFGIIIDRFQTPAG